VEEAERLAEEAAAAEREAEGRAPDGAADNTE